MLAKSILVFVVLGSLLGLHALADGLTSEIEKVEPVTTDNSGLKVLTFDRFKQVFHKTYGGLLEEASRKILYMGRVFLTYMSSISYKHNKTSSYLAVNQMSDWTDEEFEKTLINHDKLRERELSHGNGKLPPELFEFPEENQEGEHTIKGYHYDEEDGQLKSVEMETTHPICNSSSRRQKRDLFGGCLKPKEVETFHDYRKWKPSTSSNTSCLQPVKSQGDCGSCYIFSVVALYEWMHCASTGQSEAFSEQFVLDCGDHGGDDGCEGGFPSKVGKFVGQFGVQSLTNYPYEGFSYQCPADDKEQLAMGRFARPQLMQVSSKSFQGMLDIGPLVVNVAAPRFFFIYGGGVDSGRHCSKSGGHSMLLVGDGRENGREFWLFRNSHSKSWGEQGYYRISKESKCLYNYGTVPFDYFRTPEYTKLFEFHENPRYNPSLIEGLKEKRAKGRTLLSRVYRKFSGLKG